MISAAIDGDEDAFAPLLIVPFPSQVRTFMSEKEDQNTRAKFYNGKSLAKYITLRGIPKSKHAFRDMVASGSSEELDDASGLKLAACLGQVTFSVHPQQINVMDKSNGKIIASIKR
jgi:hypothetical protein